MSTASVTPETEVDVTSQLDFPLEEALKFAEGSGWNLLSKEDKEKSIILATMVAGTATQVVKDKNLPPTTDNIARVMLASNAASFTMGYLFAKSRFKETTNDATATGTEPVNATV